MSKDVDFLFFLLWCHGGLFSTQNHVSGVCLKSRNVMQSVKTTDSSGTSGAIIFPPRFRFTLGLKTLIPIGVAWSMPLLLSTTLLFLPYHPSRPFLTEIAISLLSHHCRAVLGLARQDCPVCAQTWDCSVLAKAAAALLARECENDLGSPYRCLEQAVGKCWAAECW